MRDDVRIDGKGELVLDEPTPVAAPPSPPAEPATVWPEPGSKPETYWARYGGSEWVVSFLRGEKGGRILLVGVGSNYDGEAIDRRVSLLDDLFHRQRESWALSLLGSLRKLRVNRILDDGSRIIADEVAASNVMLAVLGTAQEMADIYGLARERMGR